MKKDSTMLSSILETEIFLVCRVTGLTHTPSSLPCERSLADVSPPGTDER